MKKWFFVSMNEQGELIPSRIPKTLDEQFIVGQLILCDKEIIDYVLITNLVTLNPKVRDRVVNRRSEICRNGFHVHSDINVLERHRQLCCAQHMGRIDMPKLSKINTGFRNLQARYMYFRIESLLMPIDTVMNNPDRCSTDNIQKHTPFG